MRRQFLKVLPPAGRLNASSFVSPSNPARSNIDTGRLDGKVIRLAEVQPAIIQGYRLTTLHVGAKSLLRSRDHLLRFEVAPRHDRAHLDHHCLVCRRGAVVRVVADGVPGGQQQAVGERGSL